ncbi:hypothetical protein M885DRAFT_503432, partial [Pelagophyceae sp. CCMP2097]
FDGASNRPRDSWPLSAAPLRSGWMGPLDGPPPRRTLPRELSRGVGQRMMGCTPWAEWDALSTLSHRDPVTWSHGDLVAGPCRRTLPRDLVAAFTWPCRGPCRGSLSRSRCPRGRCRGTGVTRRRGNVHRGPCLGTLDRDLVSLSHRGPRRSDLAASTWRRGVVAGRQRGLGSRLNGPSLRLLRGPEGTAPVALHAFGKMRLKKRQSGPLLRPPHAARARTSSALRRPREGTVQGRAGGRSRGLRVSDALSPSAVGATAAFGVDLNKARARGGLCSRLQNRIRSGLLEQLASRLMVHDDF